MLAYIFWHRPRAGVESGAYEEAQRAFHASLAVRSACFRIDALPFGDRGPAYEDWYLVGDWAGLGALNALAVDSAHRAGHDAAAALSAEGWAAVLALVNGPATIPAGTEWLDRDPHAFSLKWRENALEEEEEEAETVEAEAVEAEGQTVWRRQMVLGPAPEFCLARPATAGRARIAGRPPRG